MLRTRLASSKCYIHGHQNRVFCQIHFFIWYSPSLQIYSWAPEWRWWQECQDCQRTRRPRTPAWWLDPHLAQDQTLPPSFCIPAQNSCFIPAKEAIFSLGSSCQCLHWEHNTQQRYGPTINMSATPALGGQLGNYKYRRAEEPWHDDNTVNRGWKPKHPCKKDNYHYFRCFDIIFTPLTI